MKVTKINLQSLIAIYQPQHLNKGNPAEDEDHFIQQEDGHVQDPNVSVEHGVQDETLSFNA